MVINDFFIQLVLILFFARFLGEFVARFRVPSVIGELLAGLLLGPSILNWIQPTETIKILAEIGIVLLLFEVGLETNIGKLAKAGIPSFVAAMIGVIFPMALGFVVSFNIFHLSLLSSLFVGSTLTATSIGITLRVLSDLKKQASHEAQIVLGAAVIDDIIGVVLLAVLYDFSVLGTVDIASAGKILFFILLFLLFAPIAAKIAANVIKRYDDISEIPGLLPTTVVSLLMLFAWLAHKFGAPDLLGGFAAGLALSKHFFLPISSYFDTDSAFSERIERKMIPIVNLFTPIFFVTIGLSLNFREIAWDSPFVWSLTALLFFVAVIGKLFSGLLLIKETKFTCWAVGIAMIPRGEVGLIFAEIGKTMEVFNQEVYATLIIVIALTTLFTPFALRILYRNQ